MRLLYPAALHIASRINSYRFGEFRVVVVPYLYNQELSGLDARRAQLAEDPTIGVNLDHFAFVWLCLVA